MPHVHNLTKDQIEEIYTTRFGPEQFLYLYEQPDWCDHEDAVLPFYGCWSLTSGFIQSERNCQSCSCWNGYRNYQGLDQMEDFDETKLINGKYYPLWQQFVDKKHKWIGGTVIEHGYGSTNIIDITLSPNGEHSAYFRIEGETFSCGFDVKIGSLSKHILTDQPLGGVWFSGYSNHQFGIYMNETANENPTAQ